MPEEEEEGERGKVGREWRENMLVEMTKLGLGQKHLDEKIEDQCTQTEARFEKMEKSLDVRFAGIKESVTSKVRRVERTLYGDGNGDSGLQMKVTNMGANVNIMSWKFAMGLAVLVFVMNLASNAITKAMAGSVVPIAISAQKSIGGKTP